MTWNTLRRDRSTERDSTGVEFAARAVSVRPAGEVILLNGSDDRSADRCLVSSLSQAYTLLSEEILVAGVVRVFPVKTPPPLRFP